MRIWKPWMNLWRQPESRKHVLAVWWALKASAAVSVVGGSLLDIVAIEGQSMVPTFEGEDNIVLVERLSTYFISPPLRRNDIVISRSPEDPAMYVCKRVKALAGETIPEDALPTRRPGLTTLLEMEGEGEDDTVPPGHVWLVGDNRQQSKDSRSYGPVPVQMVYGRVIYQLWPISKMQGVHWGEGRDNGSGRKSSTPNLPCKSDTKQGPEWRGGCG